MSKSLIAAVSFLVGFLVSLRLVALIGDATNIIALFFILTMVVSAACLLFLGLELLFGTLFGRSKA